MRPAWESGWRGRLYSAGRRIVPLSWRRAIRRRIRPERLLGIRKPDVDLPRFDFDPAEMLPGRPDILFLPVIPWSYRRQRPQQLAEALGRRGKRVFYGALAGRSDPDLKAGVAPGVTLLPIPGVRWEDPADRRLQGRQLEDAFDAIARARAELEMHEAAVVVQTPFWTPLALRLRERFGWKIVYDCLDEHGGFAANRAGLLSAEEAALVPAADLVVATSGALLERLAAGNADAHLVANACDFELFSSAAPRVRGEGPPTVGYVGAVDDWFDAGLFNRLTELRADWRFEVVGGAEGSGEGRELARRSNVIFHGERPHAELPAIRSRFDVEIIPFRLTPLTHAVDPVKLYEAAAAGRPTVATRMRSLSELSEEGIVRTADSAEGFAAAIEEALEEPAAAGARRREFARANTWDTRAAELQALFRSLYSLVSVVIPVWNGLAWTRLCLESLDRRTDWPSVEVVVADNGSTDGTADWLREQEATRDPDRFRVVRFSENRGFAAAINAAAAAAQGRYLCLLNNDTVVTRGWLSALIRHLGRDPDLGMVGASTNEIANAARVEVGYRSAGELDAWARRFTAAHAGRADPIDMLAMFCVLLPRAVWKEVGPLDERFLIGMFEDDDYARRLEARGRKLAVARDAFVHHWGRGTFRTLGDQEYMRIYRENRARFEKKWGAAPRVPEETASWSEVQEIASRGGEVFVFPPSIGWDITLVQRPHHLARAFARAGCAVVFELDQASETSSPPLRRVEPGLFVSARDSPEVRTVPNRIYWAFAYNVPGDRTLSGARLVYDAIDDLDVFPQPRSTLRANQSRALARADAVFAVSHALLEELRGTRPDVRYLPNGVDSGRFAAPPDLLQIPEELLLARDSGRPIAGFIGALARWVDAGLIRDLAALRPDWDFFLIGERLGEGFDEGDPYPENVRFAGRVPHATVPSVLSAFDVGLIPFRLGAEGVHASPIKLYEYLAAGLPVIATPIPECASVPEVRVARDAREMASLLDDARESRRSSEFRARAQARAKENDWSRRAARALETLRAGREARLLG